MQNLLHSKIKILTYNLKFIFNNNNNHQLFNNKFIKIYIKNLMRKLQLNDQCFRFLKLNNEKKII